MSIVLICSSITTDGFTKPHLSFKLSRFGRNAADMGIKEIRLLLKERLKSPQHCILVSSHNLTEIAAVTDVLIFIRGGKIIKIVKNDYNEKELEALYEDIMTSGQREEA